MQTTNIEFIGYVFFKSTLDLEELGSVISKICFGGLPFGGKEEYIHEEIPAIYINAPVLGLRIELDGYSGLEDSQGYSLTVRMWESYVNNEVQTIRLDNYLNSFFKKSLINYPEIIILEE